MGHISTMQRPGLEMRSAPQPRPARRDAASRLSLLPLLALALATLVFLLPGGLLPGPPAAAGRLAQSAAAAAGRVAASLARQPDALHGAEGTAATLAAALAEPAGEKDVRLLLVAADGRVLARAPAGGVEAQAVLAVRQAVEGWPLQVVAERSALPLPGSALLPLGIATAALVLLAYFARRWECQARASALAEQRRDAQRSAILAESAARLRLALGAAELGSWAWDEAADEVTWDARAADILGDGAPGVVRSKALLERLVPADHALLAAALASGRRSGEPTQCALRLRAGDGEQPRWIELRIQASAGPRGLLWHGVIGDVTARRAAEEAQQRLLREVDHRAKNALAVVQALLRLTRADDPGGVLPRIEARIAALARAHTLLAQSRWEGAALQRLAAAELRRRRPDDEAMPCSLSGPPVMLSPIAAQPMAMVLHELTANAAQHGALAHPDGQLDLAWYMLPGGGVELVWQERRPGMLPPGPVPAGLGTRILDATVRDQLGGQIGREWRAEGLRCAIRLPPACVVAAPAAALPAEALARA